MSDRPRVGAPRSAERLNPGVKKALRWVSVSGAGNEPPSTAPPDPDAVRDRTGRAKLERTRPFTVVSMAPARADRRDKEESAPRPASVPSDAHRREFAKMRLNEVADVAARNESPAHGYAARVEMDRRVAQAQISAASAQRDAANILRMTLWAVFLLIPAALLGVVIGLLLFKLLRVA